MGVRFLVVLCYIQIFVCFVVVVVVQFIVDLRCWAHGVTVWNGRFVSGAVCVAVVFVVYRVGLPSGVFIDGLVVVVVQVVADFCCGLGCVVGRQFFVVVGVELGTGFQFVGSGTCGLGLGFDGGIVAWVFVICSQALGIGVSVAFGWVVVVFQAGRGAKTFYGFIVEVVGIFIVGAFGGLGVWSVQFLLMGDVDKDKVFIQCCYLFAFLVFGVFLDTLFCADFGVVWAFDVLV